MTQGEFPFRDSAEDATAAAIHKSGESFKRIACEVWPSLSAESAYARLRASLDPDQRAKLTYDEHLLIANLTEQFDVIAYACQATRHAMPDRIDPDDERAELQRQFVQAIKTAEQIGKRLGLREVAA